MNEGGDQGVKPLQFIDIDLFTTFQAEYTLKGNDLVLHFFPGREWMGERGSSEWGSKLGQLDDPDARIRWAKHLLEHDPEARIYWLVSFPTILEQVAMKVFAAGPPRVVAAYTLEAASWWLEARGYAVRCDEALLQILLRELFTQLDVGLDPLLPIKKDI